jgi:predicted translin family RNA/ssDNA-binding protein
LTRQSKKLISQLQRCTYAHSNPAERTSILEAGRTALQELHHLLAQTVSDFKDEEYHRFGGAFSPGLQEFIESASLLYYLETGELITQLQLESDIEVTVGKKISIPLSDYIVGILDLG